MLDWQRWWAENWRLAAALGGGGIGGLLLLIYLVSCMLRHKPDTYSVGGQQVQRVKGGQVRPAPRAPPAPRTVQVQMQPTRSRVAPA